MEQQRPKARKTSKQSSEEKQHRDPPRVAVPWGRGASEYRPGIFTKRYFVEHGGEGCAADIFYALSEEIERLNVARVEIDEAPFRRPNYSSFSRYFHWFLILKLIERTDKREAAIYDFLQKRVFYILTAKGRAEVNGWEDPVRTAHPEFG